MRSQPVPAGSELSGELGEPWIGAREWGKCGEIEMAVVKATDRWFLKEGKQR